MFFVSRLCGLTTVALAVLAASSATVLHAPPLRAQAGGSPPAQPGQTPVLTAYRGPAIALVQPSLGGTIPQDRPVVVFRFAPGEPTDPIDATTFRVTVDGDDRTTLFQVAATEAWGPLARPAAADTAAVLAPGEHQVAARICSSRGACSTAAATVNVVPGIPKSADAVSQQDRRRRLLDLLIDAARRLIAP